MPLRNTRGWWPRAPAHRRHPSRGSARPWTRSAERSAVDSTAGARTHRVGSRLFADPVCHPRSDRAGRTLRRRRTALPSNVSGARVIACPTGDVAATDDKATGCSPARAGGVASMRARPPPAASRGLRHAARARRSAGHERGGHIHRLSQVMGARDTRADSDSENAAAAPEPTNSAAAITARRTALSGVRPSPR